VCAPFEKLAALKYACQPEFWPGDPAYCGKAWRMSGRGRLMFAPPAVVTRFASSVPSTLRRSTAKLLEAEVRGDRLHGGERQREEIVEGDVETLRQSEEVRKAYLGG